LNLVLRIRHYNGGFAYSIEIIGCATGQRFERRPVVKHPILQKTLECRHLN